MNPLIYILALCVPTVTPITPQLVHQIRSFGNQAQETVLGFLSADDEFILQDDNPPLDDPFEEMNNFLLASEGNLQVDEEQLALVNLDPKVSIVPPLDELENPAVLEQEIVSELAGGIEPRIASLEVGNVPSMPEVVDHEVLVEEEEVSPIEEEEEESVVEQSLEPVDEEPFNEEPSEPSTILEGVPTSMEPSNINNEEEVREDVDPAVLEQEIVSELAGGIEPRIASLEVGNVPSMPEVVDHEVLVEEEVSPIEEEEEESVVEQSLEPVDEEPLNEEPSEPSTILEVVPTSMEPFNINNEEEVREDVVPIEETSAVPVVESKTEDEMNVEEVQSDVMETAELSSIIDIGDIDSSEDVEMMAEDIETDVDDEETNDEELEVDQVQPAIDRQDNLAAEDERPRQVRIQRGRRIPARNVTTLPLSPGRAPNVINPPEPSSDTEPSVPLEEEVESEEDDNLGFVSSFFKKFLP